MFRPRSTTAKRAGAPPGFHPDRHAHGSEVGRAIQVLPPFLDALDHLPQHGHDAIGSKALSVSKVRLFSSSLVNLLKGIAAVVNRHAIPRLMSFNGLPVDRLPVLEPGKVEDVDLQGIATYLKDLTGAGADVFPDEVLEEHLLGAANLPSDPTRERGPTAVDELRLMVEEIKAARTPAGPAPGQPAPKQLTEGDLSGVEKALELVIKGLRPPGRGDCRSTGCLWGSYGHFSIWTRASKSRRRSGRS